MVVGSEAGSVGTGERRMRRRPAAGGAELGQLFEEEEKAAALGAGEARRWRSNGSHGSIDSRDFIQRCQNRI
jgi:hypothetical protein